MLRATFAILNGNSCFSAFLFRSHDPSTAAFSLNARIQSKVSTANRIKTIL